MKHVFICERPAPKLSPHLPPNLRLPLSALSPDPPHHTHRTSSFFCVPGRKMESAPHVCQCWCIACGVIASWVRAAQSPQTTSLLACHARIWCKRYYAFQILLNSLYPVFLPLCLPPILNPPALVLPSILPVLSPLALPLPLLSPTLAHPPSCCPCPTSLTSLSLRSPASVVPACLVRACPAPSPAPAPPASASPAPVSPCTLLLLPSPASRPQSSPADCQSASAAPSR